jgi:F0F1-type ATP synthase assembly protein I
MTTPSSSQRGRGDRSPGSGSGSSRAETKRVDAIGWRLAGVGGEFASHVVAGVALGWGVDWYFGVSPWGILIGSIAGLAVGALQFVKSSLRLNKELGPVQRPPGGWAEVRDEEPEGDSHSERKDDRGDDEPSRGRPSRGGDR